VGFALAKPTFPLKESASAISFCPFFSVVRLSVFALCLCPFSRLYLPWYPSFLSEMDCLSVKGVPNYMYLWQRIFLVFQSEAQFTTQRNILDQVSL
jgi:hypothetical protein